MNIDPRGLRLFLAVCREGTISGAAHAQHLSQPTVSVAIAQLERQLGAKLFERHRQGIRLTPAGQVLQQRAEAMEHLLDAARREVRLVGVQVSGPLFIGGTPGALATLVPKVLESFMREFPRFELRILERSESDLHELLRKYQIDLAVVTAGMHEHPEDLRELALMTDPFSLIVGRANDQLPNTVSLPDLADARWVLPEAVGGFRRQIDALFVGAQAATPCNVIRSDSLLTTKAIVRHTDYVTILPREVAAAELSTGVLRAVRIREVSFERQVGLLWLTQRKPTVLAQAFLDHARRATQV